MATDTVQAEHTKMIGDDLFRLRHMINEVAFIAKKLEEIEIVPDCQFSLKLRQISDDNNNKTERYVEFTVVSVW